MSFEIAQPHPASAFSDLDRGFYTSSGGYKALLARHVGIRVVDLASDPDLNQAEQAYDLLVGAGVVVPGDPLCYTQAVVGQKIEVLAPLIAEPTVISDAVWVVNTPSNVRFAINKPHTTSEANRLAEFFGAMKEAGATLSTFTLLAALYPNKGVQDIGWYSAQTEMGPLRPDMDLGTVWQTLKGNGHIAAGFTTHKALEMLVRATEVGIRYRHLDATLRFELAGMNLRWPVASAAAPLLDALALGFSK